MSLLRRDAKRDISITLPWPDKSLWPNNRTQHRYNGVTRSAAVNAGNLITREALTGQKLTGPLMLDVVFHPPNKIRRDLDNMFAAMKHFFDGISQATGVDDSEWGFTINRGDVVKGGQVVVIIRKGKEWQRK